MKILVAIPSYRPMSFIGCVHTAWRLRTPPAHEAGIGHHISKHDVEFITCHHEDDFGMHQARYFWDKYGDADCKIHWIVGNDRDCISVGGKWNKILNSKPGQECDVITFLGDKTIPLTRDWDSIIGHNAEERPKDLMWWYYVNTLVGQVCCCIPIITRTFLDANLRANIGPLVSDMFPYWHVDGWLEELSVLIQGYHVFLPIECAGLRGRTTNCYDVKFWNMIYAAAATERIKQASAICRELYGKEPEEHNEKYGEFKQLIVDRARTAPHMVAMVNDEQVCDINPPSEGYLTLKAEAEKKYAVQLAQMQAKVEEVDRLKMQEMGIDISDPAQIRQYLDL